MNEAFASSARDYAENLRAVAKKTQHRLPRASARTSCRLLILAYRMSQHLGEKIVEQVASDGDSIG